MPASGKEPYSAFTNRVRLRVNGLIVRNEKLLLLKMKSPTRDRPFWIPPGGGVELGEPLESALQREILEETGISIRKPEMWYISEYIHKPWHAVEFYFFCREAKGDPHLGSDPELDDDQQFLMDCSFVRFQELSQIPLVPTYLSTKFIEDYRSGKKAPEFIPWHPETR